MTSFQTEVLLAALTATILVVVLPNGIEAVPLPAKIAAKFLKPIPLPDATGTRTAVTGRTSTAHAGHDKHTNIFSIILKVNSKRPTPLIKPAAIHGGKTSTADSDTLYQGDIVLSADLRLALSNSGTDSVILLPKLASSRTRRAVSSRNGNKWPAVNGRVEVPYVIESSSVPDKRVIVQAMNHWSDKVPCIQFVPKTSQTDYISFFSGQGCYSWIGRTGGRQRISIGRGCTVKMGVVAHEIGHALGFWHEQSRPDRDNYVKILWNNIQSGKLNEFVKINGTNDLGVAYDLASLMHYGPNAFAKASGLNTIESLDGSTDFGQQNSLSDKDIKQARLLYCSGTTPTIQPPKVCPHKDKSRYCPQWAAKGYCAKSSFYYRYMKKTCRRTCLCTICEDKDDNCSMYMTAGVLCTDKVYKNYMSNFCAKTCRVCT